MPDLRPLEDPRCRPAPGSKAAGLARASRLGLPVLDGWVVPAEALRPIRRIGVDALAAAGAATAQLAVSACSLDPEFMRSVRGVVARFPHGAIVRSSSPLDADPSFSGAFATYHEVGVDELETAIVGCVASTLTRDAVARCEASGIAAADIELEVLVQPWEPFDVGGTSTATADGSVRVVAAAGGPAALAGGLRSGTVSVLDPAGPARGGSALAGAARLARAVVASLGADQIEWGSRGGDIVLLQVRRTLEPATAQPVPVDADLGNIDPFVERVARLAVRFPGPIGDGLVLPWAVALDRIPEAPALEVRDTSIALDEVERAAAELTSQAWDVPAAEAVARWQAMAAQARSGEPGAVTEAGERLHAPDLAVAVRALGLWRGIGERLAADGVLAHPAQVWRLSPERLRAGARGAVRVLPVALGPDRWEMFVAAVAAAVGDVATGTAVAPGVGAGLVHRLVAGAGRPGPRAVLVAHRPVPQIAPLLWGCAGLVTVDGSDGAHLFEVARSLGVPAVTSPGFGGRGAPPSGALVAIDGRAGSIAVLNETLGAGDRLEIGA